MRSPRPRAQGGGRPARAQAARTHRDHVGLRGAAARPRPEQRQPQLRAARRPGRAAAAGRVPQLSHRDRRLQAERVPAPGCGRTPACMRVPTRIGGGRHGCELQHGLPAIRSTAMQAHQSVALQRRLWIALHWRLVPLIGAAGHATALTALPRLRSVAAAARRARAAAAEAGVDGGGLAGGGRAVPVCVGRANRCRHSAALPARQLPCADGVQEGRTLHAGALPGRAPAAPCESGAASRAPRARIARKHKWLILPDTLLHVRD